MKAVVMIDEAEFSELVTRTYQRPYRLQQQLGCMPSGTLIEFATPTTADATFYGDVESCQPAVTFNEWLMANPQAPAPGDDEYTSTKYANLHRELYWERDFYPPLKDVVNDLHTRGLLPAADYIIYIYP